MRFTKLIELWLALPSRFVLSAALTCVAVTASGGHPNVLLICVDDLRPELSCYGQDYIVSPNIDQLAAAGVLFRHHYVQAPTCGASRYTLLTGRYGPPSNDALFVRAKRLGRPEADRTVFPSMPQWFRENGYTTVSVGKVSHHPGGRGGPNWDDDQVIEIPEAWDRHLLPAGPWQHPRGAMHGLAHGEIRVDAGKMDVYQSQSGPDTIYPDGLILETALDQLHDLSSAEQPFFLAVGIIRPHLPFGAPAKYMEPYRELTLPPIRHFKQPTGRTTWHRSGEFMKYHRWGKDPNQDADFATEVRRHYAACVTFADALMGRLLRSLDETGKRDETIVVLWGDHGWHLGEHAIWGKHALFEESLHAPLIIQHHDLKNPGSAVSEVVETLDIFPTLCDLAGLPKPGFAHGRSLRHIMTTRAAVDSLDPQQAEHGAIAYRNNAKTLRTATHRLIQHDDGFVELYDHRTAEAETHNIAPQEPELVQQLQQKLRQRLALP